MSRIPEPTWPHTAWTACANCGWSGRPSRLWCPRCSGRAWTPTAQALGTVLAITQVHRAGGVSLQPPTCCALVLLDPGGQLIAGAAETVAPGDRVRISYADGAFRADAAPAGTS